MDRTSPPVSLRYVDKNSMSNGIQARFLFLYGPLFDYLAFLRLDRKLGNGWTNFAFRLAMRGIVPDKIRFRRTKMGFQTTERKWPEKELREKLVLFFSDVNLVATKYYRVEAPRELLRKRDMPNCQTSLILRIVNLELWYHEFLTHGSFNQHLTSSLT